MVGEALAGLGALKTAFDLAKGLKDINDATIRNGAVIELQEKILAAQVAQAALLDQVRELEQKVAGFEAWNTEKDQYDLKALGNGATAYMLKPDARGTQPPTWICTNCYEQRHKATLQSVLVKGLGYIWTCPKCKNTITPGMHVKWLD